MHMISKALLSPLQKVALFRGAGSATANEQPAEICRTSRSRTGKKSSFKELLTKIRKNIQRSMSPQSLQA